MFLSVSCPCLCGNPNRATERLAYRGKVRCQEKKSLAYSCEKLPGHVLDVPLHL
jgi:hypothetical protein